jgi:hypothetical protein
LVVPVVGRGGVLIRRIGKSRKAATASDVRV